MLTRRKRSAWIQLETAIAWVVLIGCAAVQISEPCPPGLYGPKCSLPCSKSCAQHEDEPIRYCDAETGVCLEGCEDGFVGANCSTGCNGSSYGPGCSLRCSPLCIRLSDDAANICDNVVGSCLYGCQMGFIGTKCTETCDPGTYGYDCARKCSTTCHPPENPAMTSCNFTDGDCLYGCLPGFKGAACTYKDATNVEPEGKQPNEWNVFYVMMFCGTLFVLALLMLYMYSRAAERGSSIFEEGLHLASIRNNSERSGSTVTSKSRHRSRESRQARQHHTRPSQH
ncbi:hypothetical protein BsWGS_24559 [Bradybaena similaris]